MLLSSTFTKILFLALPLVVSAINADKDDIPPNQKFKVLHVQLKDAGDVRSKTNGQVKTERVVYYVSSDGHAIAGDVNLGKEDELLKYRKKKSGKQGRKGKKGGKRKKGKGHHHTRDEEYVEVDRRAISIFANWNDQKWPNAELKYKYNNASTEIALKSMVDIAIAHWLKAAPFFKFTQIPTDQPYTLGTLKIVHTEGAGACWAPIGWCKDCELTMSLDTWNCNVNTYVHEFGHALGLQHEHQRPDREQHMHFNCSALADYSKYGTDLSPCPGEPDKCCQSSTCYGWACQFRFITWLDYSGPIDMVSVMMYQEYSFSAGFYPTLMGINGNTVPIWDTPNPSAGDAKRICDIYFEDCKGGPPGDNPVCGNGKKEGNEECDDGNTVNGDGCSSKCTIENTKCTVCNPSPLENKCDITTSCITTQPGGQTMCACRAGYKANPGFDASQLAEWRLPFGGQETRVFVKPGIICNELCENWASGGKNGVLCGEVPIKKDC
ncbi:hypothetical protein BGX38DRAFT_1141855 [Terfezia claveryi]|nr:hypothetical protein BGX38DRAFT_1141855 [Terfezia claveryi]